MKKKLQSMIHLSLAEVERQYRLGMIDDSVFEAFQRVWDWVSPRFSGSISLKQDAFWNRYGSNVFYNRINKVRIAFGLKLIENK